MKVSEWLLFNANSSIFQLYQQEQVNFQWDDEELHFVLDQHLSWIFKVLAHWNNNPLIDMWPHSETLSLPYLRIFTRFIGEPYRVLCM